MKEATIVRIESTVCDLYLTTGQGHTIPEITERVPFGETTVRDVVKASEVLELSSKYARIRKFDGTHHQFRTVDAYVPTRHWLRQEVIRLRPAALLGRSFHATR